MLHYLPIILVLWGPQSGPSCDLKQYASVDYATEAHRAQLLACLKSLTVSMRASRPTQRHLITPGQTDVIIRGVFVRPNELVTAAAVAGLDLRSKDGDTPITAIRREPKQGLATLHLRTAAPLCTFFRDKIGRGRVFFALGANGSLERIPIDERGKDGRAFYWAVPIELPIGTPLFNAHGDPVSLVAVADSGVSYLLPSEAFSEFWSTEKPSHK